MADDYTQHDDFIRPAQNVTHPRHIVVVTSAFLASFFGVPVILYLVLPVATMDAFLAGVTALATTAQFAIFGVSAWVFVRTLRMVHGRGFFSLIGPYKLAWSDLCRVTVSVGATLLLIQVILPLTSWDEPAQVRNVAVWIAWLPVAVLAILIQVTTEEIIFRGYLHQQFACLSSSRLVWMLVPSLLFGVWHFWNGNSAAEGAVYVFWATLLGLACADVTARTGNLGAAIGLHLANNIVAVVFIGTEGWPMSGLALILYPYHDPDVLSAEINEVLMLWMAFSLVISAFSVLIMWLTTRITLKR
ncbi:MAG: type II CAAX endopeptidase family protein [Pseudomonadota bacterium]